jgi:hypothetical protein
MGKIFNISLAVFAATGRVLLSEKGYTPELHMAESG